MIRISPCATLRFSEASIVLGPLADISRNDLRIRLDFCRRSRRGYVSEVQHGHRIRDLSEKLQVMGDAQ
jgi:hypothetical protein